MGAAPRYLGRREGCIFSPPSLKQAITCGGIKKPKEATMHRSNCFDRIDSGGCQYFKVWLLQNNQLIGITARLEAE